MQVVWVVAAVVVVEVTVAAVAAAVTVAAVVLSVAVAVGTAAVVAIVVVAVAESDAGQGSAAWQGCCFVDLLSVVVAVVVTTEIEFDAADVVVAVATIAGTEKALVLEPAVAATPGPADAAAASVA